MRAIWRELKLCLAIWLVGVVLRLVEDDPKLVIVTGHLIDAIGELD